jgi:streptomycin 6-kinase
VTSFRRTVLGVHGEAGAAWLKELPALIAACRAAWNLRPDGELPLTYGYVERVRTADGTPAVLKLRAPSDPDLAAERAALAHFGGDGAARLLADDPARGALLLERLEPGTELAELAAEDDEAATAAAADVMRRLWRPPPVRHPFPDVVRWGEALESEGVGPLPREVVQRAAREYAELCASSVAPVVLHADLHHFNVLRSGAGWRAIDPHGVVGEPAYETGALLRNPYPALLDDPRPGRRLARRIDQLAEALALDPGRVRAWGRTQAVLAAAWSVQDDTDWRYFLRCAELLA